MFTFIQLNNNDNWLLKLDKDDDNLDELSSINQEKMLRSTVKNVHSKDTSINDYNFLQKLIYVACNGINYIDLLKSYDQILINKKGGWRTLLKEDRITNEIKSSFYPINNFADIVICENDESSNIDFFRYLKKRFPLLSISTINFFDLRSKDEIKTYFEKSKYVTFSTTFTNLNWFKKMTDCLNENNQVIGFSEDETKWEEALKINPNIEIVKKL